MPQCKSREFYRPHPCPAPSCWMPAIPAWCCVPCWPWPRCWPWARCMWPIAPPPGCKPGPWPRVRPCRPRWPGCCWCAACSAGCAHACPRCSTRCGWPWAHWPGCWPVPCCCWRACTTRRPGWPPVPAPRCWPGRWWPRWCGAPAPWHRRRPQHGWRSCRRAFAHTFCSTHSTAPSPWCAPNQHAPRCCWKT